MCNCGKLKYLKLSKLQSMYLYGYLDEFYCQPLELKV